MSKKRSFSSFLSSSGTEGIKKVALEYASENDSVTLVSIAQKYGMSSKVMKKIFEYAIVNCLVSYQTTKLMQAKAHRNQTRHLKEEPDATPSDKYYNKLLERRIATVKKFSDEKVKEIVELYINYPQLTAFSVAESVGLSKKELNIILKKSIIFNIVDDQTVKKMCKISLDKISDNYEAYILSELFQQYRQLRDYYITLNNKISMLYFQIEAYADYVSSDDEIAYRVSVFKEQLKKAESDLARFKTSF